MNQTLSFQSLWELPDEAYIKPSNAAQMIGLSSSRLAQLRSLGSGPIFIKQGNVVRYKVGHIKGWLKGE